MSAHVVVVGAGIVGASCARSLARRGARVTVLDKGAPATATSAHGEGNILVSDKGPGAELDLARYAAALWPTLAAELADELGPRFPSIEYERKGGLVVATTDAGAAPLEGFAASQRAAGVDARVVDERQARELEPWLTPSATAAVHYPEDAQVQPVVATEAVLASARRLGASVLGHREVRGGVVEHGQLVGVRTDAGTVAADAVVVACGPWSGHVAEALGSDLPVRPRRGMVLVTTRMPHRVHHKVYDGDYFGATQSADAALQTSAVVESTAAGTVLIGSSREQVGFDPRLRVQVLQEVAARALRLFPFLSTAGVMRSYLGFRPYMPDHLPVVGPDHRLPGLFFATGHEGAGIGLAPATGEMLAALVLGERPEHDATPFRLDRPSLAGHLAETAVAS
ncbi:NAD(P)/FAD-dependent oxidoreductase [Terracoccus luteus]|uniref:Glycine/D-amino acid oxidase-like deaminating enzyme n=1 Tax=Terracoccus luteus TaxID=53356 RepID=A0A839PT93_9MICO|nr:FAD-dependent oxidoreductase [Terracoccus luteus]MBB2985235.1 glycine/D-amino acid oxidase-like deaminating enzyme [Terracoccus luteus]MCP2170887.1 glycine/D-amino acid oxidase-like deaminating enzyme [Terracoccus luteus]